VSGQYVTRKGKTIEVTQRYTLFISYNKESQAQTMKEAQERITLDFQAKYGNQFNISNVFVPVLPVPAEKVVEGVGKGGTEDMEFYSGSRLFKAMSAYEKQRYDIGTQRNISEKNIDSIRQRYRLRRR
jgi:hypothetical protein